MAEERLQRRLAAILAADVVGYSSLMEVDEAGTLARLRALRRELFEPMTKQHGGRIFKTTGDGALVEFKSAVDAVNSAVEIQRAFAERDEDIAEERRIRLRIGLSLGDVIVEGSDLYGNGVNVAARMEGLAEPGGVCISGNVYEHVRGTAALTFDDLGEQQVKNIERPVHAFRVRASTGEKREVTAPLSLPDRPSIAVLPFDNMSGDPDQEYFSDGITEDIITALSRVRHFFVIARNTAFTFKGRSVDVLSIARELGVRYVLEGSVRKARDRLRISAQLIDGQSGNHIWAERYDRKLDDIFAIHDDITRTVVGQMEPEISRAEQERAARRAPENLDAWTLYQRGLWHYWKFDRDDLATARRLFEQAIEVDPNFAPAHAFLAYSAIQAITQGFTSAPDDELDAAVPHALRAVSIDDRDALSHWSLGAAQLWRRDHKSAVQALERAIELNPSFAHAYNILATTLTFDGRSSEAIPMWETALRLSPNDPVAFVMFAMRGAAHLNLKQFEEARDYSERARRRSKASNVSPIVLMSALGYLAEGDYAREVLAAFRERNPPLTEGLVIQRVPFGRQEDVELWLEGLRRAGVLDRSEAP